MNFRSTSSEKVARAVRNSVAMGAGGVCADDGNTLSASTRTITAINAVPAATPRFLFSRMVVSLRSVVLNSTAVTVTVRRVTGRVTRRGEQWG